MLTPKTQLHQKYMSCNNIPGFQEKHIDLQENKIQKTKFPQLPCSSFRAQLKDKPITSWEAVTTLPKDTAL
jgi:hypothetical protein